MYTSIKRQAKSLSKEKSIKLSEAQQYLAISYGFADFHEMQQVVNKVLGFSGIVDERLKGITLSPLSYPGTADGWEPTLQRQTEKMAKLFSLEPPAAANMVARLHGFASVHAISYQDSDEVVADNWEQLDSWLEDEFSGTIASSNANNFTLDDYKVLESEVVDKGIINVVVSGTFSGEQDLDRPITHTGTSFDFTCICQFEWDGNKWVLGDCEFVPDYDELFLPDYYTGM